MPLRHWRWRPAHTGYAGPSLGCSWRSMRSTRKTQSPSSRAIPASSQRSIACAHAASSAKQPPAASTSVSRHIMRPPSGVVGSPSRLRSSDRCCSPGSRHCSFADETVEWVDNIICYGITLERPQPGGASDLCRLLRSRRVQPCPRLSSIWLATLQLGAASS